MGHMCLQAHVPSNFGTPCKKKSEVADPSKHVSPGLECNSSLTARLFLLCGLPAQQKCKECQSTNSSFFSIYVSIGVNLRAPALPKTLWCQSLQPSTRYTPGRGPRLVLDENGSKAHVFLENSLNSLQVLWGGSYLKYASLYADTNVSNLGTVI